MRFAVRREIVRHLPVEAIETEYPLLVENYSLVEDSGGAGQYRGGMGLRRVVRPVDHECLFNGALERAANQPWGIFGGGGGAVGRFILVGEAGQEVLAAKPLGVHVKTSEKIVVESPGAGGYGPPANRSAEMIDLDQASGKFSDAFIRKNYSNAMPKTA